MLTTGADPDTGGWTGGRPPLGATDPWLGGKNVPVLEPEKPALIGCCLRGS